MIRRTTEERSSTLKIVISSINALAREETLKSGIAAVRRNRRKTDCKVATNSLKY
jgi:hypothetical protein